MSNPNRFLKISLIILSSVFLFTFANVQFSKSAETVTVSASLFESLLKKIDSLVAEVSSLKKTVADFISRENKQTPSSDSESTENNTQTNPTGNSDQTSNPATDSGSTEKALDNLTNSYGGQTQSTGGNTNSGSNNSNQNTDKSLTSEIGDWFKKVLGLDKQKSPSSTPQKQEQQQPAQQQQQPSQQQQQQGQQPSGQENGTSKKPFKLEPNQFKKKCGQNIYKLHYRIGGIGKRDMLKPTAKEGTGAGGKEDTGEYIFQVPTCAELAECHCCCNTCVIPETEPPCIIPGWVFAKKGCAQGCSDKCDANCEKGCKDWKKPTPPPGAPFDRDCECQMEGCPDGKDCKIFIDDEGTTAFDFTKKDGNPEQFFPGAGYGYFKNGNGPNEEGSKIRSNSGNDTNDHGWIKRLEEKPGVCCSCTQQ